MAKTDKKTTKPVTIAERVKRIELDVNRHGANMAVEMAAMREQLARMEILLTRPQDVIGSPVDIKAPEEQGLEPGDYTDASKEVADELTAMGYAWSDEERHQRPLLRIKSNGKARNFDGWTGSQEHTLLPRPEFIARARVTAKQLGLVPEEAKKWKPEVGDWVMVERNTLCHDMEGKIGRIDRFSDEGNAVIGGWCVPVQDCRPATSEEEAKYHADQEAAKPIVPYVTKAMYRSKEWYVVYVPRDPVGGMYSMHRTDDLGYHDNARAKRHEFKVIDP